MKEKIKQKGIIQTPLLIGFIVLIVIALIGTGVVLYKQGKLDPFIASISHMSTEGLGEGLELMEKEEEIKRLELQPEEETAPSSNDASISDSSSGFPNSIALPTPIPPTNSSTPLSFQNTKIMINNGAGSTRSTFVKLTLTVEDKTGIVGYFVSESSKVPTANASKWIPVEPATRYNSDTSFTLNAGNGIKTIYVWFKNAAGKISSFTSDSIVLATYSMDNIHELAITPDGGELYAWSMESHNILVVDMHSGDYSVIAEIKLPGNRSAPLSHIIFSPDGRYAYLSNALQCVYEESCKNFGDFTQIIVIDTQSKKIASIIPMQESFTPTGSLAVTSDGKLLYFTAADFSSSLTGIGKLDLKNQKILDFLQMDGVNFITLSPDEKYLYVAQGWNVVGTPPNLFSVVDINNFQLVSSVSVGNGAQYIAVTPNGRKAYISNQLSNNLSVVDLSKMEVKTTINVGLNPREIAITPDGKKAYVGNTGVIAGMKEYSFGSTVSVIDIKNDSFIKNITSGPEPQSVVMDPSGKKIYTSDGNANGLNPSEFHIIDTAKDIYQRSVTLRGAAFYTPTGIDATPDGRRLFVISEATTKLLAIDTSKHATISVQHIYPRAVKVSSNGRLVYAFSPYYPPEGDGRFFILDSDSLKIIESINLGEISTSHIGDQIAYRIILNNNEDTAYLTNGDGEEIIVLNLQTKKIVNRIPTGGNQGRGIIPAKGIAITPDETKVFVSSCISQNVSVLDVVRNTVIDTIKVGNCPSEIEISQDGKRVYVLQQHTTDMMTIIDVDTHKILKVIDFPNMINAALDFILSPDERYAYVACFDPNWIMVIDIMEDDPGKTVKKVIKTGLDPFNLTATLDNRLIYVTNFTTDDISVIDTKTNSVIDSIKLQY